MFKLSVCFVAALAAFSAPFFAAQGPRTARPFDLPPGPMQAKARTACLECHDAGIILQQRLSKDAWGKEVDKMVRWGTLLDPKDRDPLIDYLSTNFPPDKPGDGAPRIRKQK
jgi:hypothetical protein